jgi:hypothetical protein
MWARDAGDSMPQQQHAHAGTLRYLFCGLPQRVRLQSQALDALLVLIVPFTFVVVKVIQACIVP